MPIFTVGAAGTTSTGFDINGSAMFYENSLASRTVSSAGNRRTFTISQWVKKSTIGASDMVIFCAGNSTNDQLNIFFRDTLTVQDETGNVQNFNFATNATFTDTNAWYHIVIAVDTTQATESNRFKMYVNGQQITSFNIETYPTQNLETNVNKTINHSIAGRGYQNSQYFDGYLAECVLIDGQQLTPTSFGEFDTDSGIWKPIDPRGLTFGTNGHYYNFATKATDPVDASGNGHNMTSSNVLSTDYSKDTPFNNYCTLNANSEHNDSTFSDGNLTYTGNASAVHNAIGSIGVTQGKWYFEAKRVTGNSAYPFVGVFKVDGSMGSYLGATLDGWTILMDATDNGEWRNNGTLSGTSAGTFTNGNIAMIAIDMDNGKIWFGKDGTWAASGNPSAGSGEQYSNLTGTIVPAVAVYTGASVALNFGSPLYSISSGNSDANGYGNFEHAVPTGFYAINSKNLAEFG